MSADGQRTKWRRKSSENFNRLSRAHERYRQMTDRQTTDGRTTTYSEHELEFTFAKNWQWWMLVNFYQMYLAARLKLGANVDSCDWCRNNKQPTAVLFSWHLLELSRVECLVMARGLFGRKLSRWEMSKIPIQDYKSLRVVVMICATLVSTETAFHQLYY